MRQPNTLYRHVRDTALDVLPPLLARAIEWRLMPRVRRVWRQGGVARVETLDELDRWLARADAAAAVSADELVRELGRFEFVPHLHLPRDPFSPEYREAQMALYRHISGHADYRPAEHELTDFDFEAALRRPYPYFTGSTALLGEQLVRQGRLIGALGLRRGARVVEFGAGFGNLTLELARIDLDVTAVDISPRYVEFIARRSAECGLAVSVERANMLEYRAAQPFDAAIFYESFHHCSDHMQMLRNLREIVKPDGLLAFGAEPIGPLPYPWGVRLDGQSLWSTRRFGWLENGFTRGYFARALARSGWQAEFTPARGCTAEVVIARRC